MTSSGALIAGAALAAVMAAVMMVPELGLLAGGDHAVATAGLGGTGTGDRTGPADALRLDTAPLPPGFGLLFAALGGLIALRLGARD